MNNVSLVVTVYEEFNHFYFDNGTELFTDEQIEYELLNRIRITKIRNGIRINVSNERRL